MKPFLILFFSVLSFANPYPDPNAVPKDGDWYRPKPLRSVAPDPGIAIVRVEVAWLAATESYELVSAVIEKSGTEALIRRAQVRDPLGSYQASLKDFATGRLTYDSTGTGKEFRKLTRALTFRFPLPRGKAELAVTAENPKTGKMEEVLRQSIDVVGMEQSARTVTEPELKLVQEAEEKPALMVNIYAEGYLEPRKDQFWKDAGKVVEALKRSEFPGVKRMEFRAIFLASNTKLGAAENLGLPVPERDSYLGLYFPYWNPFGRWYHVVYPTRESRYRQALGQVPYDYPIAIIDNSAYWGVGNFNEITAIPAHSSSFTYLLLHEFGHYFGLNEEYEGGGPTELEFAPEIEEPWSQNITFLKDKEALKWKSLMAAGTPLPTPSSAWTGKGPYGAYRGGYADSEPKGHSHKPGFGCVMTSGSKFCPICKHAIEEKVKFDLGG